MGSIYDSYDFTECAAGIGGSSLVLSLAEMSGIGPTASTMETLNGEMVAEDFGLISAFGATSTTCVTWEETSEGGAPDIEGKIGDHSFKGWFRDNIPYTNVEGRAYKNFNNLHPDSKISNRQSFIKVDTKETYEAVSKLFGNKSREQILEDLEVLERVLTDEKERRYKVERMPERV